MTKPPDRRAHRWGGAGGRGCDSRTVRTRPRGGAERPRRVRHDLVLPERGQLSHAHVSPSKRANTSSKAFGQTCNLAPGSRLSLNARPEGAPSDPSPSTEPSGTCALTAGAVTSVPITAAMRTAQRMALSPVWTGAAGSARPPLWPTPQRLSVSLRPLTTPRLPAASTQDTARVTPTLRSRRSLRAARRVGRTLSARVPAARTARLRAMRRGSLSRFAKRLARRKSAVSKHASLVVILNAAPRFRTLPSRWGVFAEVESTGLARSTSGGGGGG